MKILIALLSLCLLSGCKKTDEVIQQKQENLILQAMITGQWVVTTFNKGGTDVTPDYQPYKFQFKKDGTVDAVTGGAVEKTGTWSATGDAQAQFITAEFTTGSNPLLLLNGTWEIRSTTWTSVNADQKVGAELRSLRLDKQ